MSFATKMAMKPYLSYKDSRSTWLGKVPADWEVRPIRTVAQLINGATPSTAVPEYWDGNILWVTPDDLGKSTGRLISSSERRITQEGYRSCGTTIAPAGSIALSTRAPIGHIGVITSQACTNQGCRLLALKESILSLFAFYILSAARPELESLGKGTTFSELSRGELASFRIPLPPLDEQAAIVRYLDTADQQIQACINAKQRLIELLEEERQAIIHQAVTRGLDPNVRLKPSGVEWLGGVPEHWEIMRARFLLNEVDIRSATGTETHLSMSQVLGLVPSNLVEQSLISNSYAGGKLVEEGDLVLNRLKAHLGVFALAKQSGVISPEYSVFRKRHLMSMKYFEQVFRLPVLRTELRIRAKGIVEGFWRLYTNDLFDIRMPVPSFTEQQVIVDYLDKTTAITDAGIARARQQIELIEEYRTRLIADVVTGKLDVREAAEELPTPDPAEITE